MKIVKIKGGLGNQMFQYAYAKLLEKCFSEDIKLDFSYFNNCNDSMRVPRLTKFNLTLSSASDNEIKKYLIFPRLGSHDSLTYKASIFFEKYFNSKYCFEERRDYEDPILRCEYDYYDGYWQANRYVEEVLPDLKKDFVPIDKLSEKTLGYIDQYESENSVFVGVRKGDYVQSKAKKTFGDFSSDYYLNAMRYIAERVDNPCFHIFSNDIGWCKNNLRIDKYKHDFRESDMQVNDFEELILMSKAKHAIIVNSTYNWWGATLIENCNKIVCCPERWFWDRETESIINDNWIRIKDEKKGD